MIRFLVADYANANRGTDERTCEENVFQTLCARYDAQRLKLTHIRDRLRSTAASHLLGERHV